MVELLAPVGNREMLVAAINAGADAVYFGIRGLNMRDIGSSNFTLEELPEIVGICHGKNVRAYLAVNTIVYEGEDSFVDRILLAAKAAGVDAVIAWDFMVLSKARALGLELHVSTQASVSNFEALRFYAGFGVKRFVLARELDLDKIKKIKRKIADLRLDVKIECFIHGAMCFAESGRCFMSQIVYGKSANRGECLQVCRRKYRVRDVETDAELELENAYVMSPKDICTMPIIDKLLDAGIDVFKIEGRARSPEYVKVVVESYREAISAWKKKKLSVSLKSSLVRRMERVYNRGFETGFYLGKPINAWAGTYGSAATTLKVYIGTVTNYYAKKRIVEVKVEACSVSVGDEFYLSGPTSGVVEGKLRSFMVGDRKVSSAKKGDILTFRCEKVRKGDKFFKIVLAKDNPCLVQNY